MSISRLSTRRRVGARMIAGFLAAQLLAPPAVLALDGNPSTLDHARSGRPLASAAPASLSHPDNSGAIARKIPVWIAPGTGGMQPTVELTYSSAERRSSWVGYGWNLRLGAIERSLAEGVPAYDATDEFIWNGSPLILVGTDPNTGVETYETRVRSYDLIARLPDDTWEIRDRNGTVSRYGLADPNEQFRIQEDGGATFSWLLAEVEDVNGNGFRIQYDFSDPGQRYPLEIRYTLRRTTNGLQSIGALAANDRVVRFVLEAGERPDVEISYEAGFERRLAKCLHRIEVVTGSPEVLLRRYELEYDQSPDSGRSLLARFEDHGFQAAAASSPRVENFEYTENGPSQVGWEKQGSWTFPNVSLANLSGFDMGTRIADINGDGYPDLVRFVGSDDGFHSEWQNGVYYGSETGWEHLPDASMLPPLPTLAHTNASAAVASYRWTSTEGELRYSTQPVVYIDLNRDGLDDVVYYEGHLKPNKYIEKLIVAQNFGSGWLTLQNESKTWDDVETAPGRGALGLRYRANPAAGTDGWSRLADLNGDGRLDILSKGRGASPTAAFHQPYRLLEEAGFGWGSGWIFAQAENDRFQLGAPTHHYDDASHYFETDASNYSTETLQLGKSYADVNGDGLADLTYALDDGTRPSASWINTGTDLDPAPWAIPGNVTLTTIGDSATPPDLQSEDQGWRFADINGDGQVDLLRGQDSASNGVHLNSGDDENVWLELDGAWAPPETFVNASGRDNGTRLVDLDGDGLVDLLHIAFANRVYLNKADVPDLLEAATNSYGGRVEYDWAPAGPIPGSDARMRVVAEVRSYASESTTPTSRATFSYDDPEFDGERRAFRGFRVVQEDVSDPTSLPERVVRRSVSTFHQTEARTGRVESHAIGRVDSGSGAFVPMETRTYTYTPDTGSFPADTLVTSVTLIEHGGSAADRRTKEDRFYDAYGNDTGSVRYGEVDASGADLDSTDNRSGLLVYSAPNLGSYIVDRVAEDHLVASADRANGPRIASTFYHYDGLAIGAAPTLGRLTSIRRDRDTSDPDSTADPIVSFEYDSFGNVVKATDPRGNETTIDYDSTLHAFPARVTNPLGHRTITEYEPDGDSLCTVDFPLAAGLVFIERRPNDPDVGPRRRDRCYDAYGRITLDRGSNGTSQTNYSYDDQSAPQTRTAEGLKSASAPGREMTTTIDGFGRTIRVEWDGPISSSAAIDTAYDALGRRASQTDPYLDSEAPRETRWTYDALSRPTSRLLPSSLVQRLTQWSYEPGEVTETDPVGDQTVTFTDAFGQVEEVRELLPGGHQATAYSYEVGGQVETITDAGSNVTMFAYDSLGRLTLIVHPDSGARSFEYDVAGNVLKETGPLGDIDWTYDALNRPLTQFLGQALTSTGTQQTEWEYDLALNGIGLPYIELVSHNSVVRVYSTEEYDEAGRALEESINQTHTFSNQWNMLGQRTHRTLPTGDTLVSTYDSEGYLTGIGSTTTPMFGVANVIWDAAGRLRAYSTVGGLGFTNSFDAATGLLDSFEVKNWIGLIVNSVSYEYDAADRVDERDRYWGPHLETFEYDALGRLEEATGAFVNGPTGPMTTLRYAYDALGNMTCRGATDLADCSGTGGTAMVYPSAGGLPHAPASVGGVAQSYDATGNLAASGTRSYEYDAMGRLVHANNGGSATRSYFYRGFGRGMKSFATGPGYRRDYFATDFDFYPSQTAWPLSLASTHLMLGGRVVGSLTTAYAPPNGRGGCAGAPAGAAGIEPWLIWFYLLPLSGFIYARRLRGRGALAPQRVVAALSCGIVLFGPIAPFLSAGNGVAHASTPPAGVVHYHADLLGSTVGMTGATGDMLESVHYLPFGDVAPGFGSVPEFGFTGQRTEGTIGLYDYGGRFYDPVAGRFVQPDPVIPDLYEPQALNPYAYVVNRPTTLVDPSGHGYTLPSPGGLIRLKNLDAPGSAFPPRGYDPKSPSWGGVKTANYVATYAKLARGVSNPGYTGDDGFARIGDPYSDDTGMQAMLFGRGDERVLAFAGTDGGSLANWSANLRQAFGLTSAQYATGIALAVSLSEGGGVHFVGHSLGAGIAAASAIVTGGSATIFNAAGVHPNTVRGFSMSRGSITHFQSSFDALRIGNALTPARVPGTTVSLGAAGFHGMAGVCRAVGC